MLRSPVEASPRHACDALGVFHPGDELGQLAGATLEEEHGPPCVGIDLHLADSPFLRTRRTEGFIEREELGVADAAELDPRSLARHPGPARPLVGHPCDRGKKIDQSLRCEWCYPWDITTP